MGCGQSTPQQTSNVRSPRVADSKKKSGLYKIDNVLLKIILLGDSGLGHRQITIIYVFNILL